MKISKNKMLAVASIMSLSLVLGGCERKDKDDDQQYNGGAGTHIYRGSKNNHNGDSTGIGHADGHHSDSIGG